MASLRLFVVALVVSPGCSFESHATPESDAAAGADHDAALSPDAGSSAAMDLGASSPDGSEGPPVWRGVRDFALGATHACALLGDGTVWCWGSDAHGELGDGATARSHDTPVQVVGLPPSVVVQLALGDGFSCAQHESGKVTCWGRNDLGQLGNGSTTDALVPTPIVQDTWATADWLSAAGAGACVRMGGHASCWGGNASGELGSGAPGAAFSAVPVQVVDETTPASGHGLVFRGANGGCVQYASSSMAGQLGCWGDAQYAQLGAVMPDERCGLGPCSTRVAPVLGDTTFGPRVALGDMHRCVLGTDQTVACWGSSMYGALGSFGVEERSTPVAVPGLDHIIGIDAYRHTTCAVRQVDGGDPSTVWCWGDAWTGVLGREAPSCPSPGPADARCIETPTRIDLAGGGGVFVRVGSGFACALDLTLHLACWGANDLGQLGDGIRHHSAICADLFSAGDCSFSAVAPLLPP